MIYFFKQFFFSNKVLGKGGGGEIWKGQLTDSKLVRRYNMGPIAVKFIKSNISYLFISFCFIC